MNYHSSRRPSKRRITGRFYVFLTMLLVAVVLLCVMISSRTRGNQPAGYNPPVYDPTTGAVAQNTTDPGATANTPEPTIIPTDPNVLAKSPETPLVEATPAPVQVGEGIEVEGNRQTDEEVLQSVNAARDLPTEWANILFLGSDSRDMSKIKNTRCDTIMIISVNKTTGQLKMCSIMRDTMIEVPGKGFVKINDVTVMGGPNLMMQVINQNFGLNITDYAIVNFKGMANIIDILGGITLTISKDERNEINRHMGEIAEHTMSKEEYLANREGWKLQNWGEGLSLNGIQAVTYARIRIIDSDHNRTKRQRNVINAIMAKVKGANLGQLLGLAGTVLGNVDTTISADKAVALGWPVLNCKLEKDKTKEWRIPSDGKHAKYETRNKVEAFYDVDYEQLKTKMYAFIYTDSPVE